LRSLSLSTSVMSRRKLSAPTTATIVSLLAMSPGNFPDLTLNVKVSAVGLLATV
jgi:hypothetical protein